MDQISVRWSWNFSLGVIENFLWAVSKSYIRIFFPPQIFGKSWQGCRLGIQTCLLQLIALIYLESTSSYLLKTSFVDFWLVCILFIGPAFIDPEIFYWAWLKIFSGLYPNRTYGFSSPAGLWKVVARVTVGCSELFTSIDWFAWSKISFNFFVQAFFFLSLTCFYHLYWILVH